MSESKNVSSRVMLAMLNISVWSARKFDNKATFEIEQNHSTKDIGRFNKKLLPENAASYKKIQEIANQLRALFYAKTLKYGQDGIGLLPAALYMELAEDVRTARAKFIPAVDEFIEDLDNLKREAKVLLNGLFLESDYPSREMLLQKFNIGFKVLPFPDAEKFGVELPGEVVEDIKESIAIQMDEATSNAMNDLWYRLYGVVTHMADKLAKPNAIFRDSLIENLRDMCDLLPQLNFVGDKNLTQLCDQVKEKLYVHEADSLRSNETTRADAAKDAIEIQQMMANFMGIKPPEVIVESNPQQLLIA